MRFPISRLFQFLCFHFLIIIFLVNQLMIPVTLADSLSFNFSAFQPNTKNIFYQGDAFASNGIQLTKNQRDQSLANSVGRVTYNQPLHLWDRKTQRLASFMTHFSFVMNALNSTKYGDGLSFFLSPSTPAIPLNSYGGFLGLFNNDSAFDHAQHHLVAVEFDSFKNTWDPSENHVGININSIVSVNNVSWNSSIKDGRTANAWVWYDSTTQNLSVFLSYAENATLGRNSSLSYVVDLRSVLPEWVCVGFSAATGDWIEIHTILSWEFDSNLELGSHKGKKTVLKIGVMVGILALVVGVGVYGFMWWRNRSKSRQAEMVFDAAIDDDFQKGSGPKRFSFRELSKATNNFSEGGKLGEGGFGGVYKGLLGHTNLEVAVKRVSRGSKQGQKEYVSEVKTISRLRHRNLVQLVGWCHEKGEFLLVYEFMPNGSLDSHLFYRKSDLSWLVRYKIALGLASALLYLHEEWEQCVVHRDIKSSNVMLDSNYNAKLGDFGLARLVDHDLGSQTTVLAGTMGYLAPECVTTGKASKESDVYSFGVVALEIACGRRPIDAKAEPGKLRLVEWVWELYGEGRLFEAVDRRLNSTFDEQQMECLMVVGLWCCHPDHKLRPSIRQVINVLNFGSPLPSLPSKLPVATYYAPPITMCRFTYTSSVGRMDTTGTTQSSSNSSGSSVLGSSKALLNMRQGHDPNPESFLGIIFPSKRMERGENI